MKSISLIERFHPSVFGGSRPLVSFVDCPETSCFWVRPGSSADNLDLEFVDKARASSIKLSRQDLFLRVNEAPLPLSLGLWAQSKDSHGVKIVLSGTVHIAKPRIFLNDKALAHYRAHGGLELNRFLANHTLERFAQEVETVNFAVLVEKDALPGRWWRTKLIEFCPWLEVDDIHASYDSQTGRQALDALKQKQQDEREQALAQAEEAKERAEAQAAQAYEEGLRRLAEDRRLSNEQRQAQRELARLEYERRKEQLQADLERQRMALEHDQAVHAAKLAALSEETQEARKALLQAKAAEKENEKERDRLESYAKDLGEIVETLKAAHDQGLLLNAQWVQTQSGLGKQIIESLYPNDLNAELRTLIQAHRDASAVNLSMQALQSRDINALRRADAVAAGSSLKFDLHVGRTGHLTCFNIGTSGSIKLLAPNFETQQIGAEVMAGDHIAFPGEQWLPPGFDFVHDIRSPLGEEYIGLIVSDAPLIDKAALMAQVTPDQPLWTLSPQQTADFITRLKDRPSQTWAANYFAFVVQ